MAEALKGNPLPDEKIGGDDAELLRIARERYQKAIDADRDNREAGLEDLEFLAGEQWPAEIVTERTEDGRPILTINRMPQFVHQVTGDIRQNKPSIKVRPAGGPASKDVADLYSGLIRNIEADSDAGTAYHTAAEGAAQCGIGHFRIVTEYSEDDTFEQNIRIRRITDPFAVTWDPHAIEPTRSDARFCFVEEDIDRATFEARYPDSRREGFDFQDTSASYLSDWIGKDSIRIAEYWTKTPVKRKLALLNDGRTIDITDKPDRDGVYMAEDGTALPVVKVREVIRSRIEMRIINGAEVLAGPFEWPGYCIPIIPVLGEEIHVGRKTVRHGVIRHARDAQRMYNYWRSAQTEQIALQPKSPYTVTVKNITGFVGIWKEANKRNLPYLPYTPDAANGGVAPQRNAPPMASSGMAQEVMIAAEDMKASTGIYDAGLGNRSNETSGKAILARKQESDVATYGYTDNLTRSIRHAGRILIELIPLIYDTERQVRILNEDETTKDVTVNQRVLLDDGTQSAINDLTVGKYDVVVTTGPSYTTKRAEAADGILQLVQAVPDIAKLVLDILARNLDWPGADEIAERIRKTLPPGLAEPREGEKPSPPPPPTPEQQAAIAEQERKNVEAAAKAEKTAAETEGVALDNAKKQVELAMMTGDMQQFIESQVMATIARMLQAAQPQMAQPMPQPPVDPGMTQ